MISVPIRQSQLITATPRKFTGICNLDDLLPRKPRSGQELSVASLNQQATAKRRHHGESRPQHRARGQHARRVRGASEGRGARGTGSTLDTGRPAVCGQATLERRLGLHPRRGPACGRARENAALREGIAGGWGETKGGREWACGRGRADAAPQLDGACMRIFVATGVSAVLRVPLCSNLFHAPSLCLSSVSQGPARPIRRHEPSRLYQPPPSKRPPSNIEHPPILRPQFHPRAPTCRCHLHTAALLLPAPHLLHWGHAANPSPRRRRSSSSRSWPRRRARTAPSPSGSASRRTVSACPDTEWCMVG